MPRYLIGLSLATLVSTLLVGCSDSSAPAAVSRSAADSTFNDQADSVEADRPAAPERIAAVESKTLAVVEKPVSNRILDRGFDDIKFDMEKDEPFVREMLTPAIEKLVGKKIRIRGYILPTSRSKGLRTFVLVRDNLECCFGPGAALFDCILVKMEPGLSTSFSVRPIAVEGVFEVREFLGPDGKHLAIYHLLASKAG